MWFELLVTVSEATYWTPSGVCQWPKPQGQILTQIWYMWKIAYEMLSDMT